MIIFLLTNEVIYISEGTSIERRQTPLLEGGKTQKKTKQQIKRHFFFFIVYRPKCQCISTTEYSPIYRELKMNQYIAFLLMEIDVQFLKKWPSNEWLIHSCIYDTCFGSDFSMHILYLWIVLLGNHSTEPDTWEPVFY